MCTKAIAAACLAILLATISMNSSPAIAQDENAYPSRPVRIVVPLPAGSAPDIQARIVAKQLNEMWGRGVVVENRPGGGGIIGTQTVLSAPPDGYTLLFGVASIFTVLPAQKEKPKFDVNRELVPIGLTSNTGFIFAASSKLKVNTLGEFITMAKREPYKLVIGTNPAGSLPHLAAKLFVQLSKAPITVVPSNGGTNDAIREIMGGRAHAVIEGLSGLRGALDAGDIKALAIMAHERTPVAPEIPTAAETVPGLVALGWTALLAPKGTPQAVVERLTNDLRKVLEDPDTRAQYEKIGVLPFRPVFAADLARFIADEQKLWRPVVEAELK